MQRKVFEIEQAEEAFRYMAAGKHIGKVLIKIRDSQRVNELSSLRVLKKTEFHPNKAYIIVGGFGGLGLEIALWMTFKGARNIVLNSRRGPQTSYHQYCIERMTENGVKVTISRHDLISEDQARELLKSLDAPVAGIFNSALVLNDALFVDQTAETFIEVCAPKVNITLNLDKISREMCPSLAYFVVFSSAASSKGNVGQTNYGLANSFIESVCERRRRDGLHGLAIQWGVIGDVGYVVEKMGTNIDSVRGTAAQRLHSCFAVFERFLNYPDSTVSSMVKSEGKIFTGDSSGDIIKSISHILGIKDIHALDPKITLGELGMDSLMAIEVQQALERNFDVTISSKEIRQMKICELIELSKKCDASKSDKNANLDSKLDEKLDSFLNEDYLILLKEPKIKLNDGAGEILFVMPPIDGQYRSFGDLFKNLEQSVVGLNWTYDMVHFTSMDEAAVIFADQITSLTSNPEVNILGYSFGGVLAIAIAKQLESRKSGPKVGKLVLFDTALEALKERIREMFISQSSSEAESVQDQEFIKAFLKRYLIVTSDLDEEFRSASSRTERFDVLRKYLIQKGIEPLKADCIMKFNELTLHKGRLILKHQEQRIASSEMIHFRSQENVHRLQSASNDTTVNTTKFVSHSLFH